MELVQINDTGQSTKLVLNSRLTNNQSNHRKFISLQKCLLICLVEFVLIAIAVFIVHLFLRPISPISSSSPEIMSSPAQFSDNNSDANLRSLVPSSSYRVYSNAINSCKILVGLVNGCDQRIHDLKFGVRCESKSTQACSQQLSPFQQSHTNEQSNGKPIVTLITTSKSGLRLQARQVPMKKIYCNPVSRMNAANNRAQFLIDSENSCLFKTILKVHTSERQQKILGWGGALTDSSINNIMSLSMNGTKQLLDDYFGSDGLMFNMIRLTIGGSDFSSRFYTNDDIDPNGEVKNDIEMKKFQLKEEDVLYKIPMIKYIQDEYLAKELKLFVSMWSPPIWMKTNEHFNKGTLKGSINSNLKKKSNNELYFKALAELKKNFLLAYQQNSIKFWGLTIMNEPLFSIQPFLNFNTMIFPKDDYGNYIAKYLGPTIKEDSRLKHIKLIVHDDNRRYLMNYTDPILSMNGVRRYIDGISTHGYIDEEYEMMDKIYAKYKSNDQNFFILPTELCSGHLPFMEKALIGNWHRGIHYALDIIRGLQHSAAGWVDWNMALDITGGPGWLGGRLDSPIIVDKAHDIYHKSPMFYVLGQFSRYIPPDSFKLKTEIFNNIYDYHFETVTFLLPNGNDLATVVLNDNPYAIELNIDIIYDKQKQKPQQTNNLILYQVVCAAESVTTIVYSM